MGKLAWVISDEKRRIVVVVVVVVVAVAVFSPSDVSCTGSTVFSGGFCFKEVIIFYFFFFFFLSYDILPILEP